MQIAEHGVRAGEHPSFLRPAIGASPFGMDDDREPEWRERALAVEYWALSVIVAGSLVYGLYRGVVYLAGL